MRKISVLGMYCRQRFHISGAGLEPEGTWSGEARDNRNHAGVDFGHSVVSCEQLAIKSNSRISAARFCSPGLKP